MKNSKLVTSGLVFGSLLALSACELDGLPGLGGTLKKVTSSGVISARDDQGKTIVINGVSFDISAASVSIDDNPGNSDQLSIGMVVSVEGSVEKESSTGVATHVSFENEVEGPVTTNSVSSDNSLVVLGQRVLVDDNTLLESEVAGISSIADIEPGQRVEVSGHSSGDGSIVATRVEVKLEDANHIDDNYEVKGVVSNLTATTFNLGDTLVVHDQAVLSDFGSLSLADGMYVEVKSSTGIDPSQQLVAIEIELENAHGKKISSTDSDEMEIQGIVSSTLDNNLVDVNGHTVRLDQSTQIENGSEADLISGAKVEVEGHLDDDGNLVAHEIKLEGDDDHEAKGQVEAIDLDAGVLTVNGVDYVINNLTQYENSKDNVVDTQSGLSQIVVGNWVEVKYLKNDSNVLIALQIETEDSQDDEDGNDSSDSLELEIKGSIESVDVDAGTIVINGNTIDVANFSGNNFQVGDLVEIEVLTVNNTLVAQSVEYK